MIVTIFIGTFPILLVIGWHELASPKAKEFVKKYEQGILSMFCTILAAICIPLVGWAGGGLVIPILFYSTYMQIERSKSIGTATVKIFPPKISI